MNCVFPKRGNGIYTARGMTSTFFTWLANHLISYFTGKSPTNTFFRGQLMNGICRPFI